MKTVVTVLISASFLACGSSDSSEQPAAPPTAAQSATPAPAEQPSGEPVLEPADIPGLGSVQMPRGYSTTQETDHSGNYAYGLGDLNSLQLSWEGIEGGGASNLAGARRAAGYLAGGEVQNASEMDNGMFEVITLRESDSRSFVLIIASNRYVKCNGPSDHLEMLKTMCESVSAP